MMCNPGRLKYMVIDVECFYDNYPEPMYVYIDKSGVIQEMSQEDYFINL